MLCLKFLHYFILLSLYILVPRVRPNSPKSVSPNPIICDIESDSETNHEVENSEKSNEEEVELPREILEALERQGEGSKPNMEEAETINLADEGQEPKEIKIGISFPTELKPELITVLKEFKRYFLGPIKICPIKTQA